ncbi:hypothetical protein MIMGU_mgv1a012361mg [Erythranthe guttata]|uniref:S-adenosyl-L-methionine-dependent methyltransferase n=1 Tax=Erythranthe guttata TaxID=4155 RepID=A0A022RGG1_ERYGU|nr:hypothetical protein MIMGU_mgv1a012361mg [Erythranthe guttata]
MEWSPKCATNAYLDALKLCNKCKKDCGSREAQVPESNEFISALAAGMSAKLIVEVTSEVSPSTVALAAAARQTGGKLICILPEPANLTSSTKSRKIIEDLGLGDIVEFKTGDPAETLLKYENIDFSLVDCKGEDYGRLLEKLDVNPKRSVVVANNLLEGEKGLGGHLKGVEKKTRVRSMMHPIGRGMEITMIGKSNDFGSREKSKSGSYSTRSERRGGVVKKTDKSRWIFQVDEKSGEEHIFRMPNCSAKDY